MSPIRIDFYLLTEDKPEAAWQVACRLLEKAYVKGHRVFVLCETQADAETMDEWLWTFKDDSFIPHNLQGEGPEPPPPIQIGHGEEPRGFNDILLNLSYRIPSYFSRFKRVMELVLAEETARERSRQHYRYYKKEQCVIHTHNITTP